MSNSTYITVEILTDQCLSQKSSGGWVNDDNDCAEFIDSHGAKKNKGPSFVSKVFSNGKIQWTPTVTFSVNFTEIEAELIVVYRKSGSNIMKKKLYGAKDGEIKGRINTGIELGVEESYGILFKIQAKNSNGELIERVCNIDPKIRMA